MFERDVLALNPAKFCKRGFEATDEFLAALLAVVRQKTQSNALR
jgi:hypothetical protein